jgi:hypothetical protein
MESAVFHVNSSELNHDFLEGIKSFFKNQDITIIVKPNTSNGVAAVSLFEAIERGKKADFAYTIPNDEFDALADKFIENNDFDIIESIKTYKMAL